MKINKKINKKIIFSLLCISVSVAFIGSALRASSSLATVAEASANSSSFPIVIIDAGHGGEDGGASSKTGLLEKNVNLSIAVYLRDFLKASGVDVVMTRESDRQIYDNSAVTLREKKVSDTHNRAKICNNYSNSVYISIHQNNFTDSKYSGAQVFYSNNHSDSKKLAESIRCAVLKLLQPENNREIKASDDDIYILKHSENPCVLVECGFLSNPSECKLLETDAYRRKIAFAVYSGIMEYCNNN